MKLYTLAGSPNCRKVIAVIHQLGIDVEIQQLQPTSDDLEKPEYLAINPNGMTPTLKDGDFTLWESNAIMQYLASTAPENDLYPNDPKIHADITRWHVWEQAHFGKAMGTILWENFAKPAIFSLEPDMSVVEKATPEFHRFAKVLESQLNQNEFVLGNTLTLADFALAAPFMYAEQGKVPLDDYPNIRSWYGRIEQLPAWIKSAPPAMQ